MAAALRGLRRTLMAGKDFFEKLGNIAAIFFSPFLGAKNFSLGHFAKRWVGSGSDPRAPHVDPL